MDNPEKLVTQGTQDTGQIHVREYWRGNQKGTIQKNWQHREHKTKTNTTKQKIQHRKLKIWATWTPPHQATGVNPGTREEQAVPASY